MTAPGDLQRALDLHRAGRLADAGDIYKRLLQANPDNVDALHLMGAVVLAAGDADTAITLIRRATRLQPDYPAPHVNLGNALQAAGRTAEAAEAFRTALDLAPDLAEAASNLANALNALGRFDEAAEAGRRAVDLAPAMAEAHNNLGNALAGVGDGDAAEAYRRALALRPDFSDARYNLGRVLAEQGAHEDAFASFTRAVALDPGAAVKHYNLGNAALALDRFEAAAAAFGEAARLDPGMADAHNNLGAALQSLDRLDEAVASLRRALALDEEAADVHWNLALALLQAGDYEAGWREYEWRWRNPDLALGARDFPQPLWDGGDLDGATILIHAEQGYGDTLQFVRYVPLVAGRGGRVVLECPQKLVRLLGGVDGVGAVVARGDPLPEFAVQAPMMSLPAILGTTLDTVPADVPYLDPSLGQVPEALQADGLGLKVGIAWAGSRTRRQDHLRSVAPERFAPLVAVPGTTVFSLQVTAPAPDGVHELAPDILDFADNAAAVAALDLVIAVDTATVHLAGALGRPVWVLLSRPASYLWMSDRDDSPWYPTARLFRQPRPGDWDAVFAAVAEALADLAT